MPSHLAEPQQLKSALATVSQGCAQWIAEHQGVMVGIARSGFQLAQYLKDNLKAQNQDLLLGSVDVAMRRDDLNQRRLPEVGPTQIDFDLDGQSVLLVDDVLQSGRTVRAALEELHAWGRPARVALAVLVDRGDRELPIEADIVGMSLSVPADLKISLDLEQMTISGEPWS